MKLAVLVLSISLSPSAILAQDQAKEPTTVQKADQKVSAIGAKIKTLEDKSLERGAKTRDRLDRFVDTVKHNATEVRKGFNELTGQSEGRLSSLRRHVKDTFQQLQHDFQKAMSFLNKAEKRTPVGKEIK